MTRGSSARETDVVVVGGGIAGLTAAYDLEREGARVVVCEARSRAGGLVHTERVDGVVVEAGPDALLAQKPSGLALCHELGLTDEIVTTLAPRTAFVLKDGTLHPIPAASVLGLPVTVSGVEQCRMLTPDGRLALRRALEARPAQRPPDDDESVASFVTRHWSQEAARVLGQPILAGIHAGDAARLSVRALFPALAAAEGAAGTVPAALAAQRAASSDGEASRDGAFRALRGGMSRLVERLAGALSAGTISLDTPVDGVDRIDNAFRVRTPRGELRARAVVLAAPAWSAAALLEALDAEIAAACAAIPYASSATITLAYPADKVGAALHGSGFVVPRGEGATRLLAVSWVTSKWANRAPAGTVVLRAFAGGRLDEDLLDQADEQLAGSVHRDLAPILQISGPPAMTRIHRAMRASPQYEVGHAARVAALEQLTARHPGLWLTGSAFRGVGIPDTIADARAVAARVAGIA